MKSLCYLIVEFFYARATGPGRVRTILTPVFAFLFLCFILLALITAFFLDRLWELPRYIPQAFGIVLSLPFLVSGGFLWLSCVKRFLKTKGTPVPVNPPPVLVTDGPYAYSRNPMMTGVFLMLAGCGILSGSIALSFIVTPLFVLVCILEFRYIEEPELEKRFGRAYIAYRQRTPLMFPRIHRKDGDRCRQASNEQRPDAKRSN
jgi:protein-S-isoprenylcysteine O-methyltransferase Ste14